MVNLPENLAFIQTQSTNEIVINVLKKKLESKNRHSKHHWIINSLTMYKKVALVILKCLTSMLFINS